jgi:hypothetical protein
MTCEYCGREIAEHETYYQAVHGWAKTRTQGGVNALALRGPNLPERFACVGCITRINLGLVGQEGLFE